MEENKTQEPVSYDKLKAMYEQSYALNQQLHKALVEQNTTSMFQRLNYLFKVVDSNAQFTSDFRSKCVAEIEEMMTIPEDKEE